MTWLGRVWRRPDIVICPAGKMWTLHGNTDRGREWLRRELEDGHMVVLSHDAALDIAFKAMRDHLVVCSDPVL